MIDRWKDRLSEFLDGELSKREAVELEWHLQSCLDCRRTIEDLREVKARAQALPAIMPETDLWPSLLARLETAPQLDLASLNVIELHGRQRSKNRRRITFTLPQLAAASVALMLASSGLVWVALRDDGSASAELAASSNATQLVSVERADYTTAVRSLEAALQQQRPRLDPGTIAVIEQSLRVIDSAIADAQSALQNDPNNPYLHHHLESTMLKKVQLLRRATGLRGS